MWEATSCEYWNRWTDKYVGFIPCVLFEYSEYDKEDLEECYSKEQFENLKALYSGITEGNKDEYNDEFAKIIRKPSISVWHMKKQALEMAKMDIF